ncbi:hypothetical protein WJX79_007134 [Trebouxia sp. C0005]
MADGQFQQQEGYLHQASHQNPWQHELDRPADIQPQDWACAPSTGSVLETAFTDFLKQENAQAMQSSMHMPAFYADGDHGSTLTQQMVMEDLLADCSTSDPAPSSGEMGMQYLPDMLCPPTNPAFKPGHQPDYLHQPAMQYSDHATSPIEQMEAMQEMTARQAVEQLLQGHNKAFWGSDAMLVQWQDELVLVKDGAVQTVVSGASSTGLLPEIHSMSPVCVFNNHMGAVSISGANIAGEYQTVLCRSQGSYVPVEVSHVAGTTSNVLKQQLRMQLPAGLSRGSVQVEVVHGGFISRSKPVLILDNEDAVAEVLQLSSMPIPGMNTSSMLRDLGRVLEFSNRKQDAAINGQQHARHVGVEEKSIAATALRLLSFSCQVGWASISELLLPIVSAMAATASELVADLERICDDGLTLLHHVVRSRNASLVSLVLTWGINNGHVWDCTAAGPAGLTALHLAALLDDGGRIADELTDACAGALSEWDSLKAVDGSTAADLAAKSGGERINAMIQRKLEGYSSGLQDQPYQFDPETGEWLEDDVAEPTERETPTSVIKAADIPSLPAVPTVFDSRAALLISAVVGAVGVVALGLRYSLEYYGI